MKNETNNNLSETSIHISFSFLHSETAHDYELAVLVTSQVSDPDDFAIKDYVAIGGTVLAHNSTYIVALKH